MVAQRETGDARPILASLVLSLSTSLREAAVALLRRRQEDEDAAPTFIVTVIEHCAVIEA